MAGSPGFHERISQFSEKAIRQRPPAILLAAILKSVSNILIKLDFNGNTISSFPLSSEDDRSSALAVVKADRTGGLPSSSCGKCGGDMYSEYYKGLHGHEYKISDIQEQ